MYRNFDIYQLRTMLSILSIYGFEYKPMTNKAEDKVVKVEKSLFREQRQTK